MLRGGRQEGRILVLVGDVVDVSSDMVVFFLPGAWFVMMLRCRSVCDRLLPSVYRFVSFK